MYSFEQACYFEPIDNVQQLGIDILHSLPNHAFVIGSSKKTKVYGTSNRDDSGVAAPK